MHAIFPEMKLRGYLGGPHLHQKHQAWELEGRRRGDAGHVPGGLILPPRDLSVWLSWKDLVSRLGPFLLFTCVSRVYVGHS